VRDILSQGGDREPGPWPRRVAAIAVLVLVAFVIVWHLPRHRQPTAHPHRAAVTVTPLPSVASGAHSGVGPAAGPGGLSGQVMPGDSNLRLPVTGQQPAWLWPATGRMRAIGGLPREKPGYQFIRMAGGWAVEANSAARLRCSSCAGPRMPVYFLADRAPSVTLVGTANAVAPGAAAHSVWLTSYPPGADMRTATGTAQEVSVAGGPPGPQLRLPAGYVINRATDRGLLLAPAVPSGMTAYKLWNPADPQASRSFDGVVAVSASQIAWAARCAALCRVHVLDLATGRHSVVGLPGASSAVNAAFSPDGKFLALQVSSGDQGNDGALAMQLDVASMASGRVAVVPGTSVSSDALVSFGWPAGRDHLVAELSFMTKVQVASWRPGARELTVAVIKPGPQTASLIIG
jgi:hypothetical protein